MSGKTLHMTVLAVLLLAVQSVMYGQARIYTRKARLEDFTVKTMMVVSEGNSPLAIDLRNEVSSRWRLSPFEFCSIGDYEEQKGNSGYYFLRLGTDDGVAFLLLEKGGDENDADRMKRPFEVVRVPVGSAGSSYSFGIANLDVYLDIVQMFVQEAMASDRYGYGGLEIYNVSSMKGKTVDLKASPDDAFAAGLADHVVPVSIVPEPEGKFVYKMLIDAGSHELLFYDKAKFKKQSDASFTPIELKSFEIRHAVISE